MVMKDYSASWHSMLHAILMHMAGTMPAEFHELVWHGMHHPNAKLAQHLHKDDLILGYNLSAYAYIHKDKDNLHKHVYTYIHVFVCSLHGGVSIVYL